ncbi:MAG: hypothetical protein ACI4GC_05765 [Acutalibacteraceae bacterium]
MKKIILFFMCSLCFFSTTTIVYGSNFSDDNNVYSLTFISETQSDLNIVYESEKELIFDVPTEYTLAKNTPVAVNYNWVCWRNDATKQDFYPGDKIEIDKNVVLYAVWEKKAGSSNLLNEIVARLTAFIKNMLELFGYYDVDMHSVPIKGSLEDNKETNNCRLVVNGNDITDEVYVNIDTEKGISEVPLLAIVKELGANVYWENKNIVVIKHNDLSVSIDISEKDFGVTVPPGGIKSRKIVNEDLIFDDASITGLLRNMFNAYIATDYDEFVINVYQP